MVKRVTVGLFTVLLAAVMAVAAQEGKKAVDETGKSIDLPKLVKKVDPKYPEEAKEAKVMGIVVLQIKIDEKGKVVETKVKKADDDRLAKAAADAVRQWEYEPAKGPSGKPVKVLADITVNFRLN